MFEFSGARNHCKNGLNKLSRYHFRVSNFMKKTFFITIAAFVAVAVLLEISECSPGPGTPTTNPPVGVVAPASWFTTDSTVAPSDVVPFNDPDVNDSAFHLWAWQKFLSLTRSGNGKAPFEDLVQVDNQLNVLGDTIELPDSTQAGTKGIMYDFHQRAIFYTIHVNEIMLDFQMKHLPKFAAIYSTYNLAPNRDALIQKALDDSGYSTLNYPTGCVELKTSWILASSLSSTEGYYVTDAKLYTCQGVRIVKVALLGMHIIGTVENHPEFIWATYEHDGLAPDYDWSHPGYPLLGDTVSHENFLFYKAGEVIGNCPMINNATTQPETTYVFNIYPLGLARSFTSDSLPSKRDKLSYDNTKSLNQSVHAQLEKTSGPWKHYFYKGAVWLTPGSLAPGNSNIVSLSNPSLRGARALSNLTMETFAQLNFSGNYTQGSMNCFGCHFTVDFVNVELNSNDGINFNLALSHLFKNALLLRVPPPGYPPVCKHPFE
jgi:hypothetical protein